MIAEIEVVDCGVFEIDRAFDQPEPKHLRVKVQIMLRIPGNCRDVMNPRNFGGRVVLSSCGCYES